MRPLKFDAIFNTCFLVVRDRDGNVAWGTHYLSPMEAMNQPGFGLPHEDGNVYFESHYGGIFDMLENRPPFK